jgi:hypothetical protein
MFSWECADGGIQRVCWWLSLFCRLDGERMNLVKARAVSRVKMALEPLQKPGLAWVESKSACEQSTFCTTKGESWNKGQLCPAPSYGQVRDGSPRVVHAPESCQTKWCGRRAQARQSLTIPFPKVRLLHPQEFWQ